MIKERIIEIIKYPNKIKQEDIYILKEEIYKYPYFYTLHLLMTLCLKKNNHPYLKKYITITSLYSNNRAELFFYINKGISKLNEFINNNVIDNKPIILDKEMSFLDWIKQINDIKKQIESNKQITNLSSNINNPLIDKFINSNPTKIKMTGQNEIKNKNIINKNFNYSKLTTETLAKIYIEQEKYDKAIKTYKMLILKYPEKKNEYIKIIKYIEKLKI